MDSTKVCSRLTSCLILIGMAAGAMTAASEGVDDGWPSIVKNGEQQLTVHQPQVDFWKGYTNLQFRCAIAVKTTNMQEKFGVAEVEAQTVTDHEARTVVVYGIRRTLRFANAGESELVKLHATVDQLLHRGQVIVVARERVLAYISPETQPLQRSVKLNLNPPKIFTSSRPAILVSFKGKPQFRPIETNRVDLEFALNCNWDMLYDTQEQKFYLLKGDSWLMISDLLTGTWSAANKLPSSINSLPKDQNWAEVSQHVPGKPMTRVPTVFVTTNSAELIIIDGPPRYTPIRD